eukprot:SAG22_NODE_11184_length_496_cov_2.307305_1_plen_46_part_10
MSDRVCKECGKKLKSFTTTEDWDTRKYPHFIKTLKSVEKELLDEVR